MSIIIHHGHNLPQLACQTEDDDELGTDFNGLPVRRSSVSLLFPPFLNQSFFPPFCSVNRHRNRMQEQEEGQ